MSGREKTIKTSKMVENVENCKARFENDKDLG